MTGVTVPKQVVRDIVRRRDTRRWMHFLYGRRGSWSPKESPLITGSSPLNHRAFARHSQLNCPRSDWSFTVSHVSARPAIDGRAPLLILHHSELSYRLHLDKYSWLLCTLDQVCNDEQGASQLQLSRLTTTFLVFALNATLLLAWIWRTYSATMTWNLGAS